MPPPRRTTAATGWFASEPSVNSYLTLSLLIFVSGSYYYYKVLSSINFAQLPILYNNVTITVGDSPPATINTVIDMFFAVVLRHRLLFYILLNSCCAAITYISKRVIEGLFNVFSHQEESLLRKSFRRYVQTKILFLVFISHHNLFEDILIWMPWLTVQIVCMLTLDMTSSRMTNLFDLVSNKSARRRFFAATAITASLSLVMLLFVTSIRTHINVNYTLFLLSDCCLLLARSLYLLLKLFTIVDVNAQRGYFAALSAYYVDLAYDLVHDSIEFANYLHMIFFSRLAVTYCCIFLIVQAKHYYTRISTKIQKHRQHQEIIRHIGASYVKASDADLLKDSTCTICWQTMKGARKLPCGHMFHELCLRRWLEQDSSCAVCRQSLSLNLNNVSRRGELLSEDVDNAVQYFFDLFSPRENRFTHWFRQVLLNEQPLTQEQVNAIVTRVAEVFPNYERDVIENVARTTGSIFGAVDLLLARAAGDTVEVPEDGPNGFDSEEDEGTESDDAGDDDDANNSELVANDLILQSAVADVDCRIVDVTFNNPNIWFIERANELVEMSRRKYLQSSRANDIKHLLLSTSRA